MFTQQLKVIRAGQLRWYYLLAPVLVGLLVGLCYITTAIVNARVFTELLGKRNYETIFYLILTVLGLLILRPLIEVCSQILQNRVGLKVKRNLRQALLTELDHKGPMRIGHTRAGTVQSVITDGVEAIEPYFVKYFTQLVVTAITAIGLCIWIAQYSLTIALILLISALLIVVIPRIWDKALADKGQSHWIAYEDLNADFIDAMMGMNTLKSFGAAQDYGNTLAKQSKTLLETTLGQLRLSLGETGLSSMMKVLGPALGLLVAIIEIKAGTMALTDIFYIALLSVEMFRPFSVLSITWHEAFFGISALPSLNSILERSPQAAEPKKSAKIKLSPDQKPEIVFQNVTYQYQGADKPALKNLNFTIKPGEMTAIVGLSGSGKSTALGLLMGFDQPDQGNISIGGIPATNIDLNKIVSLVPQDPIIFPGTIGEILHQAAPSAPRTQQIKALEVAQANYLHLEAGQENSKQEILQQYVQEHGQNLSGGQKQRLAIARALVRNPAVLVLDESTSALDTNTETMMLNQIRNQFGQTTVLLVTHRIDTAEKAQQIIVMQDGEIRCAGTPQELAKDPNSAWSQLLNTQLGENIDDTTTSGAQA